MKYIISAILTLSTIFIIMKLLMLLNRGDTLLTLFVFSFILMIGYTIMKTQLFTKFKFKTNNEKN